MMFLKICLILLVYKNELNSLNSRKLEEHQYKHGVQPQGESDNSLSYERRFKNLFSNTNLNFNGMQVLFPVQSICFCMVY
jgi:hypothetical protein